MKNVKKQVREQNWDHVWGQSRKVVLDKVCNSVYDCIRNSKPSLYIEVYKAIRNELY